MRAGIAQRRSDFVSVFKALHGGPCAQGSWGLRLMANLGLRSPGRDHNFTRLRSDPFPNYHHEVERGMTEGVAQHRRPRR